MKTVVQFDNDVYIKYITVMLFDPVQYNTSAIVQD